jgi:hypothetical protein
MTRVDPGGGDPAGIDPQLLRGMTSQMNSAAGDAVNLVNSYLGLLSRLGLEASGLTRAVRDLAWAQDQVPMLNRWQSPAQTMAQQNPSLGRVVSGGADSPGNFSAYAAAQQAGQHDAKSFQDGNLPIQQLYAKMAANQGDPAYCTALIKALGADGVHELEQDAPHDPNDPSGAENRYVLAQVVVAAVCGRLGIAPLGIALAVTTACGSDEPWLQKAEPAPARPGLRSNENTRTYMTRSRQSVSRI